MAVKRDYYEVLGVARDVDAAGLKKAYRKLAMLYHPDQNPDDPQATERFREATEAFQVLSDPQRRASYDRFGHDAPEMGGFPGGGAGVDLGSMTDFFESVFGSVFGGGAPRGRRRRGKPGRDLQYDLTLDFEQIVSGAEVRITIPRPVRCETCGGSGRKPGSSPRRCGQCGGAGRIRLQQGIFAVAAPCAACGGTGEINVSPCQDCDGRGLVEREEEYEVSIPPGVDDGAVKVVAGGGEHGREGGPDGDLHVMIHVEEHPFFVRKGRNLHSQLKITYPQAVLGGEVEVPSVDGEVKLKIKAGTENGRVYRLRGKGVPSLRGSGRGDQLVHVEIDVPRSLTTRQRELIEKLGEELGTEVHSEQPGFLERLRSFFEG
ncbi:MAG: molecular chaperone DnaJ [Polyangia bacterium]